MKKEKMFLKRKYDGVSVGFYVEDIFRIYFTTAQDFYNCNLNEIELRGFDPMTHLIVIMFMDDTIETFDSSRYTMTFHEEVSYDN